MKVLRDENYARFSYVTETAPLGGQRVKDIRTNTLTPGGRTSLTLFEAEEGDDRPHPRLRADMPPAKDPSPPAHIFAAPQQASTDTASVTTALKVALESAGPSLRGQDLNSADAPAGSEHYWRNSIRVQRTASFFHAASAWLDGLIRAGTVSDAVGARRALRGLEAESYGGAIDFDNANTGTYHSYQHDKPFVHYLETLLASLPVEGSEAWALLPPEQQESILRQRSQTLNHLDFLMRQKYANDGIAETDIERTLGGFLIDRDTRLIVSETLDSRHGLVPAYELLRVDDGHPKAGAWVYRDGDQHRDQNGDLVEVTEAQLRSKPIAFAKLTFRRAPGDRRLRAGVRFDWDRNGYVSSGKVGWVSWAGHCDIKAMMEQLGLALLDTRPLTEHRTDTGQTTTYNRDLLLEMIASVLELSSTYRLLDGTGTLRRGIMRFGGARNDSLPDRLQFKGTSPGGSFRFPVTGRRERYQVGKLSADGQNLDVDASFQRYIADGQNLDFGDNPRFTETVEGDYNVIDVSGMQLEITALIDEFDAATGYPAPHERTLSVDLSATTGRVLLGSQMRDAARREIWEYYLNLDGHRVEADAVTWEKQGDRWQPGARRSGVQQSPLLWPLKVTLSREMKRDDPSLFQSLLDVALRQAQNINADTSEESEVWNGTVTRIEAARTATNDTNGVERWRVVVQARFGTATLHYLVRRGDDGAPTAYCPVTSGYGGAPDFLWQEFPDIGSKGKEKGHWVVNHNMAERGIVELRPSPATQGSVYVYDDHIKNVFEMIFCALGGYSWTLVHNNKRYAFEDKAAWDAAILRAQAARASVIFQEG